MKLVVRSEPEIVSSGYLEMPARQFFRQYIILKFPFTYLGKLPSTGYQGVIRIRKKSRRQGCEPEKDSACLCQFLRKQCYKRNVLTPHCKLMWTTVIVICET